MQKILLICGVILAATLIFVFINRSQNSTQYNYQEISNKSSAKIFDVRTSDEYDSGHFNKAINWPIEDLKAGKLPEIDRASEIYLYCRSGNRSAQAEQIFKDHGFSNVRNLGGLNDVKRIGGQIN